MIYVTDDHHFGHEKILSPDFEDRPFLNSDEMTLEMIAQWNRVVALDDFVIHLGDFSLLSPEETIAIVQSLKGQIILINGNHDHRTRKFWEERAGILKWFKRPQFIGYWLTHAVDWRIDGMASYGTTGPFTIWTGKSTVELNGHKVSTNKDIVLHGHTHGKVKQTDLFINCGVDAWDFCPTPLPSLIPPVLVEKTQKWIDQLLEDKKNG